MNSAARALTRSEVLSSNPVVASLRDLVHSSFMVLLIAVIVSALSVIFVTNTTRNLQAELHHTLMIRNQLNIETQQLLLEKGTWIMQSRVQHTAERELNMVMPDHKSIVVLNLS